MDKEDRRRYLVVASVFLDIVTPLFQHMIEKDYTTRRFGSFQAFMDNLKVVHDLFHLRHRNSGCCKDNVNCSNHKSLPLIPLQWKKLYSENPGQGIHNCHCKFTANPVQLKELDISLSSIILLNCCYLLQPEEEAVERLRQYKNDYWSHSTTGCITQTEFNTVWSDLVTYILRLDPSKQDDLVSIKNRSLIESLFKKYFVCLLDLHKQPDEDLMQNGFTCECGRQMIILANKDQSRRHRKQYQIGQAVFYLHQQISLKSLFNVDKGRLVTDIKMMDDGRLVFCVPDQSKVLIYNKDESNTDSIPVRGTPCCITTVNSSTVAIIVVKPFRSSYIELYDINYKIKLKWIQVPGMKSACGISHINNKLVVGGLRTLMIVDHKSEETIQKIKIRCTPESIHASDNKIFFKNHHTGFISNERKKLKCYSLSGKKVQGKILPSDPYSITSLRDGSLYVLCIDGSIHHVSGDLKDEKAVNTNNIVALKGGNIISCNAKQNTMVLRNNMILSIFQEQQQD
ncbi:unnamed protein product [Mytilus coruscus]|uniref:Uncharacterized protein n=1 Tax=Mytilus coruscus TaxID=42192 RepID=A0A6J8AWB2_MYTCO|nr:unnamed protein product [Mytilus coruscus]